LICSARAVLNKDFDAALELQAIDSDVYSLPIHKAEKQRPALRRARRLVSHPARTTSTSQFIMRRYLVVTLQRNYSTVTDFAKFLGLSTSVPRASAV